MTDSAQRLRCIDSAIPPKLGMLKLVLGLSFCTKDVSSSVKSTQNKYVDITSLLSLMDDFKGAVESFNFAGLTWYSNGKPGVILSLVIVTNALFTIQVGAETKIEP